MSNKGQIKADVYSGSNNGDGLNLSYAMDSNLLIFADGNIVQESSSRPYKNFNHLLSHAGIGYFKNIGRYGRAEILCGMGYGTTHSSTRNYLYQKDSETIENLNINAKLFCPLLQVDIGLSSKYFDCGLGLRLTDLMPFGSYTANYADSNNLFLTRKIMPLNGHSLMLEPGMMLSVGLNNVKLSMQFGLSYQLNGLKVEPNYGPLYFPYFLTFGLVVNLFQVDVMH